MGRQRQRQKSSCKNRRPGECSQTGRTDHGKTQTVITGDLNAIIKNLPTLQNLLDTGTWIDAGSLQHLARHWANSGQVAHKTQKIWPAPNCWAHGAKTPRIRTYTFVNRRAAQMLAWVAVGPWGMVDVHAPLEVGFQKPLKQPEQLQRQKTLQPLQPPEVSGGKTTQQRRQQQGEDQQDNQSEEVQTKDGKEVKRKWKETLQTHMTRVFDEAKPDMDEMLKQGNTTEYWYKFCQCLETSHIEARGLEEEEANRIRGRGRNLFEEQLPENKKQHTYDEEADEWYQFKKTEITPLEKVARQLTHLNNLVRKNNPQDDWNDEIEAQWKSIKRKHGYLLANQDVETLNRRTANASTQMVLARMIHQIGKRAVKQRKALVGKKTPTPPRRTCQAR